MIFEYFCLKVLLKYYNLISITILKLKVCLYVECKCNICIKDIVIRLSNGINWCVYSRQFRINLAFNTISSLTYNGHISPNFSQIELQTLLKEIELFSKLSSRTTNSAKKCLGIHMCQDESLQDELHWTCEKCGRNTTKVDYRKQSSKTSEGVKADRRSTTPRDLTPFEDTVIGIIGDTQIDRIPDG